MINKQGILNEGLDGDVGFFLRSGRIVYVCGSAKSQSRLVEDWVP